MTDEIVRRFADLFAGRPDAKGLEEGGCYRGPISLISYENHLNGKDPIGIYPVTLRHIKSDGTENFFVKWGACDIDYDDIQEAINFHDLLAQVGIPSYIERSRSKGWHLWVFVEQWISAATMRHALLVVRDFLDMKAREIYPKQTELKAGELGNYIRLPYPGALRQLDAREPSLAGGNLGGRGGEGVQGGTSFAQEERRVMVYPPLWKPVSLGYFLSTVEYADPKDLEKLASRYTPPVVSEVRWQRENFDLGTDHHNHVARQTLNRLNHALAWHIYNRGPMEGGDRSSTLMRLCNLVMDKGATMEEAFSIIWSADSKEHSRKYVDRYDGEQRIMELVQRVYRTQGQD